MDVGIGTLLLGAALMLVLAAIIALPLFDRPAPIHPPLTRRQALMKAREDIVRQIRELDFDYRTHKLNEADYQALRAELIQRGAYVLRQLDELPPEEEVEDEIERNVQKLRRNQ